ncbi:MAG: hypothetical protein J6W74_00210 [Bacteroidales bacterium]|nr:hypothetical protein [Bacteroidales bacterium]MBP5689317.1 hypothetical protein [Bacteroidales bacterium]
MKTLQEISDAIRGILADLEELRSGEIQHIPPVTDGAVEARPLNALFDIPETPSKTYNAVRIYSAPGKNYSIKMDRVISNKYKMFPYLRYTPGSRKLEFLTRLQPNCYSVRLDSHGFLRVNSKELCETLLSRMDNRWHQGKSEMLLVECRDRYLFII